MAVAVVAAYVVGPAAVGVISSMGAPATVASVGGAIIGGAAAGAVSSAIMGGDIGQGALIGAISGGIAGFVGSLNISNPYVAGMAQIGSGGVSGGIASELSGGKFSEGFKTGGILSASMFAAGKFFEWNAKAGEMALEKANSDLAIGNPDYMLADLKLALPEGVAVDSTDFLIGGPLSASAGKGGGLLYKGIDKIVRQISGKPLRAFIRIETHQIPGYRNYGPLKHINIGSKHIHKYNWYKPWAW